ncbi:hypothetical protein Agub_g4875 [Astrephomene gubernaculifera]|uniref:CobB/CobQ-like glutamine amidotransferase domain-containing protein n=1 Tax=Astrephomene gubernaculifera TaxID=47775 RepID=A0AAD3DND1_9CHLO|nr:hypothetical protein Agub_g4875 [Astrephomene gubernaculifera]
MRAIFLASKQDASDIEKWATSLQAAGAAIKHVTAWSSPDDFGRRQLGDACNVDTFLLGPGAQLESHIAQCHGGDALLLISVDPAQHLLPRAGVVLLIWQPQVPLDIVQACTGLPPSLADGANVKGLLLVDASPSLTLSVTHKALEGAGLQALARKPTVLALRTLQTPQAAVQPLLQLADALPSVPLPKPALPFGSGDVRIAVARDDAFGPCFHENLTLLHQAGAQLLFFSPLYDTCIPSGAQCLYLSSGPLEPERWQQLAINRPLLAAVRAFCDAGGMVLSEGAGLLYLSRSVDLDEEDGTHRYHVHDMAGVLPFKARLLPEPQTAAVQLNVAAGNPLLPAGCRPRGYLSAQAGIVVVEEKHLQSLVFGLPGATGKGAPAPFSMTYEVTVMQQRQQQQQASDAGAVATADEGLGLGQPQSEGYTVHNVLASSCLLYLPSVPGLAAHLVRSCAGIDPVGLATSMAQQLGCSGMTQASKLQLHSAIASANTSRGTSRRPSIQDVAAWGASCRGNSGVSSCASSTTGMAACVPHHHGQPMHGGGVINHQHQHLQTQHHTFHGHALPPAGPMCPTAHDSSSYFGSTYSGMSQPSPRHGSHLAHSSSTSAMSPGWAAQPPPRRSLCGPAAQLPPPGLSYMHGVVQSCSLPPAHHSPASHAARDKLSAVCNTAHQPAPPPPQQHQPQLVVECSTPPPRSKADPGRDSLEELSSSTPVGPAHKLPAVTTCSPVADCCEKGVAAQDESPKTCMERCHSSDKCVGEDVMEGAMATPKSQGSLFHAASVGCFPSYGAAPGYGALDAPQHPGMDGGSPIRTGYAHGGYGWGGAPPAAPHAWSPGIATARQSTMGLLGPMPAGPPAPSHLGGVVCCAPGACEALVAMGLGNRLSGIGADCDHPADVCASRRVVMGWVPPEEAPQGAAARGIRVVLPAAGGGGSGLGSAVAGGRGGGRSSVEQQQHRAGGGGVSRGAGGGAAGGGSSSGKVLLVDELALRHEPPGVLVLPDLGELGEGERAQLEQALVEMGLMSPGGGSRGVCSVLQVRCRSLVDVMDLMLELGAAAGEQQPASMLLERLQGRIRRVAAAAAAAAAARRSGGAAVGPVPAAAVGAVGRSVVPAVVRPAGQGPRVLVLQSLQPFVEPGRWVPEMLSLVGATSCLALPGGPDVPLSWQDLRQRAAPDVLIILTPPGEDLLLGGRRTAPGPAGSAAACGPSGHAGPSSFPGAGSSSSLSEQLAWLAAQPGWWCLPAVRSSQVYLLQSAYCVRAGPRLVDGAELLARLLLPGHFSSSRKVPAGSVMRLALAAGQRCRATLLPSYFVTMAFN